MYQASESTSESEGITSNSPKPDAAKKRRRTEGEKDGERQKRRHVDLNLSSNVTSASENAKFTRSLRDDSMRNYARYSSVYGSSHMHGMTPNVDQDLESDEYMQFIQNVDVDSLSQGAGQGMAHTSPVNSKAKKRNLTKRSSAMQSDINNPAMIISTKWLSAKELKKLEEEQGFQYKRGAFSDGEKASLDAALHAFGLAHNLSRGDVLDIMFTKKGMLKPEHKTFWTDIALAVPMRPLVAIFNFCKRAYHPLQKLGKWTAAEDALLVNAVKEYGQLWEKVSERVGRMGSDCRDRYRFHIQDASNRNHGPWSVEEEERLICIMQELQADKTPEETDTAFWGAVVKRMGGTRNRSQIRLKWNDCLGKTLKTEGPRRWLPIDAYILVHKLATIDISNEKDINWRLLLDDGWDIWSPHDLQRRWATMKKSVVGYEQMPFGEILDILLAKKGSLAPEDIADAIQQTQYGKPNERKRRGHAIRSKAMIDNSDEE
ncbi:RNA polymerase I enhancer binding protein [Serendipita sp. 405]|nr:RNA polymerase I enhancer binding protein [Serendipita sp. 405]